MNPRIEYNMEKIHIFTPFSVDGNEQHFFNIDIAHRSSLIKIAKSKEVQDYINGLKPEKGRRYILLNALGAEEFYGSNINGDSFPETGLAHEGPDYGYKTFEMYAYYYREHENKNPQNKIGDVHLSVYNPRMHRVELICSVIAEAAPDLTARIDNGDFPFVSMGSKQPFDICSICGNRATKRSEYCEHLRFYMNKILPDGRKVFARNPYPRFHDISDVKIPAELTARALEKIAAAINGEKEKRAEIEKRIPGGRIISGNESEISQAIAHGIHSNTQTDQDIDPRIIEALSKHPLEKVLATLTQMGIVLKPKEFVKLSGLKTDKVFVPQRSTEGYLNLSDENVSPEIIKIASGALLTRSFHNELFLERMGKGYPQAEPTYGSSSELNKLAYIYGMYRKQAPTSLLDYYIATLKKEPMLLSLLLGPTLGLMEYLKKPTSLNYNRLERVQKVPPAEILPTPLPAALYLKRAYLPLDKQAATDVENIVNSYRFSFDKIAKMAREGKKYMEGLSKVASSIHVADIRPDFEEKIIYFLTLRESS